MQVASPLATPLLTISLLIAMSSSSTAKAVAPRQPVAPWPLALPPQDGNLRALAEAKGAGRFFSVWAKLATTNLAEVKPEAGEAGWTVFTISDEAWLDVVPQGPVDPLELDPVLQRLVVATQLVLGHLDLTVPSTTKTVGGRTLVLKIRPDGQLVANDVPVKMVAGEGKNQLCVLEKLLFIRPEDVEIGVERARGTST
eukprot:GFUD01046920.1.p1 GENE.GFUD01046920.1~~GFUD01046920.1.p1  ORF type:complete len:198 (-),score=69.78 GFUD01046920.1:57-650(-)